MAHIKTKILVLSDTHGERYPPGRQPPKGADVVIHCGDLTEESKMVEFQTTLGLLKDLGASLTLVIAGNHDFTLDLPAFHRKVSEAGLTAEPDLVAREYGRDGEARQLFEDARASHNIHLLDEGTHHFTLANGASLTVYANPYTYSLDAAWGFQYRPEDAHGIAIAAGTDIVLTHSPPQGVLDRMTSQKRGGLQELFRAVARARPLLHCFGHVHAGWGAKLVAWREAEATNASTASHFTAIDHGRSTVLDTLQSVRRGKLDDDATAATKAQRLAAFAEQGCRPTSHVAGGDLALDAASRTHTLFVNASIKGDEEEPFYLPWLIDLDLPGIILP
ncbi:metallophosphoesterase domain-containing protein [Sporothrix schenckii 1099-18]|uniref:Metallophosphoesterase domain-containing protein n=1 Tax=Sporothrix schenckii 1099-18 TaxID=1397361 RepID=A0A0F2MEG8_SPOSC|nr:metallophosphoesterase domain-containing protein [Sporothrix schenckii 1099-18]KJR88078.1 metallophosphoesterase domain-containing protein [Sporothrix schenckii 1099-18]